MGDFIVVDSDKVQIFVPNNTAEDSTNTDIAHTNSTNNTHTNSDVARTNSDVAPIDTTQVGENINIDNVIKRFLQNNNHNDNSMLVNKNNILDNKNSLFIDQCKNNSSDDEYDEFKTKNITPDVVEFDTDDDTDDDTNNETSNDVDEENIITEIITPEHYKEIQEQLAEIEENTNSVNLFTSQIGKKSHSSNYHNHDSILNWNSHDITNTDPFGFDVFINDNYDNPHSSLYNINSDEDVDVGAGVDADADVDVEDACGFDDEIDDYTDNNSDTSMNNKYEELIVEIQDDINHIRETTENSDTVISELYEEFQNNTHITSTTSAINIATRNKLNEIQANIDNTNMRIDLMTEQAGTIQNSVERLDNKLNELVRAISELTSVITKNATKK